jgi:AraC-like DNA-binding protein
MENTARNSCIIQINLLEKEGEYMPETVINHEQLRQLLQDFYKITGIRISYWLSNGLKFVSCNELAPESAFCTIIKSYPDLSARCDECDRKAIAHARVFREPFMYTCHAGLQECVHPVIQDDRLLGFLMIGQTRQEHETLALIREKLQKFRDFDSDPQKLLACYLQLPEISKDKMLAAARMLKAVACYTYLNEFVRYVVPSVVTQVENYIKEHIAERISLDDLARSLFISKSKLSHTIRAELDISVVDLINIRRIDNVKKLLLAGQSLAKASEASGFSDPSYCSKVFKRIVGVSPRTFLGQGKQIEIKE